MEKEFITYRHFRSDNGAATVCCKVYPDENRMLVGFALCSPEDMFSKRRGRLISAGRMEASPIEVRLTGRGTFTNKKGEEKEKLGIAETLIDYMKVSMSINVDPEKLGLRVHGYDGGRLGEWLPFFVAML